MTPNPSARTSGPLLIVTGMAREVRLASGPGVETIASGSDSPGLRARLVARKGPVPRLVLSFGVAGGLDPALEPGAVVIATGVQADVEHWPADAHIATRLADLLRSAGVQIATADLAGVDQPLLGAADKAALWERTAAAAVDMESHVAAAYAAGQGVPFAAVRAVCDPASRSLPQWIGAALKPDGGTDIPTILRHLLAQPADLTALLRLARDANAAFRSLRRCRDLLGIGRGGADLVELGRDVA